jgi:ubiquinone/menaquinone biosynthesis C-methylase UbiE
MSRATARLKKKYDLLGPFYDIIAWPTEKLVLSRGRASLFKKVPAGQLLELGVGTGKNFRYYPHFVQATAVDISEGMINRASKKARLLETPVRLELSDAQNLPFPDHSFDSVVGTLVFCTVPDPVLALKESKRVLKPSGKLILLEHGRPKGDKLSGLFHFLSHFTVIFWGDHLNRDMVKMVKEAGFVVHEVEEFKDFWKLIVAGPDNHNPGNE